MRLFSVGIVSAIIILFIVMSSIFIVDERQKALVLQFGEVKRIIETPGVQFKIPFIQSVVKYDDRIQPLDTKPLQVTLADNLRFDIDAFARWRIKDVKQFRRAVGVGDTLSAGPRLEKILNSEIRVAVGNVRSNILLSEDRVLLMRQIRDKAQIKAGALGVEVIDVRIKRFDLPAENLKETFLRMQTEREREAADEIARGEEAAQRVRAMADRVVVETVSEAQKDAEIIRGQADGKRNAIFAQAFGKDPEFFAFYRSLQAYEKSLKGKNSSIVMSPDNEFFDYLKSDSIR